MGDASALEFISQNPFPDNDCKLAFLKILKYAGELFQFASEELRNDENVFFTALQDKFSVIKYIGEKLKKKREFVLKLVKFKPRYYEDAILLEYLPEFHNDDELMILAIKQQPRCLRFASERIKNSREIVLEAVKKDGLVLEFIPEHLKDREMVIEAVKKSKYCSVLKYAPEFVDDKEVVLLAAKNLGFSFFEASEKLRSDKEFVLQIVKMKGESLSDVTDQLKGDKDIVLEAVKSSARAISYVNPDHFVSDRSFVEEIVLLSACKDSNSLMSRIAKGLKHNHEFVLKCISGAVSLLNFLRHGGLSPVTHANFFNELIDIQCDYSSAMWYSNDYFQSLDEEKQLRIVRIDPMCLTFCNDNLKNNRQLVFDYILLDRKILESLSEELCNDREIMRFAIKEHYGALEFASEELKNDKLFIKEALIYDFGNFSHIPVELQADEEILEFLIGRDGSYLQYAPESWKNSRDLVLKAIRNSITCIPDFLGYSLKEDRDLIQEYIRRTGSIEYIPQEYKQDRELVLEAIQLHGDGFKYASHSLQTDRELLLIALRNGLELKNLNESDLDREIVYEACRYDGNTLKYVSEEYKDDEKIVEAAVLSEMGYSTLDFASERLRNDIDFIRKLSKIKINSSLIQCLPDSLKNDREIVINSICHEGVFLTLSEDLQNDKDLILTGLKYSAKCYRYASDELQNDEDVMKAVTKWIPQHLKIEVPLNREMVCVIFDIKSLRDLDYSFRDDRQFALLAVNAHMKNFTYVSNRLRLDRTFILEINPKQFDICYIPIALREDREIALKSLECNGQSIIYLSTDLKNEFKNDREIMLKAIKTNAMAFLFASEELQNEEEFVLECAQVNGRVLQYVPDKFSYNRNIVLKCAQNHEAALQYVGNNEFLGDKEIVMSAARSAAKNGKIFNSFGIVLFNVRNDPEIVLKSIESDVTSLEIASYEIISSEDFIEKAMDINIEALCYAHYSLRYNVEFLKRMNKNNRIVESSGNLYRKFLMKIDFKSLLEA